MKKYLALLLALSLVFALSACGAESSTDAPDTPAPASSEAPADPAPESEAPEAEKPQGAAYEVTYTNAKVWTNSLGTPWVQTIVEITNTGDTDLYLSSGAYDLEDSSGALVTARTMVSAYPNVIVPGEKCRAELPDAVQKEKEIFTDVDIKMLQSA